MKLFSFILWLLPWGLTSVALTLFGHPVAGILLGVASLVGVALVVGLMQGARGN